MPYSKATLDDEAHINLLLAQAKRSIELKSDDSYKASWLISGGIGSAEWKTKDPGKSKIRNVNFDVILVDGTRLTDPENYFSLVSIQKVAYHVRMGKLTSRPIAPKRWYHYVLFLIKLLNRLLLDESHFLTKENGFMLLTENDCIELIRDYSQGGWVSALGYKDRLIAYLHSETKSSLPLQPLLNSADNLDQLFLEECRKWLQNNNHYVEVKHKGKKALRLSRNFLITTCQIPKTGMSSILKAFICQFEPSPSSPIKSPRTNSHRKHASQNQKISNEIVRNSIGEKQFSEILTLLKCTLSAHNILPEIIPHIVLSKEEIQADLIDNVHPVGHTNLIPLSIGLDALNEAAKWVLNFGPAIVEMTISLAKEAVEIKNKSISRRHWGAKITRRFLSLNKTITCIDPETQKPVPLTQAINIAKLTYHRVQTDRVTASDFKHIIDAFVGACVTAVSILKPIRDTELHSLSRNCLDTEFLNGGILLKHEQMKAGMLGINPEVSQAIPSITARAVQLLQLMGGQLAEIFGDKSDGSDLLFYYPSRGYGLPSTKSMSSKVNACLDKFCDMIETPVDEHGRRWYIRIHEMRKFFLFVMHRHEGERITEILRRAASHKDRKHIDSYTAENTVDEDIVRYTSECVEDRLIALSKHVVDPNNNRGLVALYNHTCEHFGVSGISGMKHDQLLELLSDLRLSGRYEISTYTIILKGYNQEVISLEVAIKFGDIQDENFDS